MSTSVTTAGQLSFSTLRTTTNAVSSSPEALPASTTADAEETGTRRQQVIDILAEKLSVYSEQYQQLLNKGLLIDTTPAQNMLKSSLSQLTNIGATSQDNSGETAEDSADVKLSWDITFDKNMDKDGDGKIDGDIDYSTFTWSNDNDHGDGSNFPESDWEIYANISTELRGLQTGYMDVYTDLANQSVEFLNDVNSFKSLMVTFISSDEDKMKIDVAGVNDALDAIIYGWGIYDADGNLNLTPINPETSAGPFPERGPVAIRGLDAQGVYYWADQLELSDQLTITTHIEAGTDGKMSVNTGDPADDIDNVTVVDSVANSHEPPEEDDRLYLVAEADGTYTLYVYPDLQPIRDAVEATISLYASDIGGDNPINVSAPTNPLSRDFIFGVVFSNPDYYGDREPSFPYDYKNYDGGETTDRYYYVLPPTEDLYVVSDETIDKTFYEFNDDVYKDFTIVKMADKGEPNTNTSESDYIVIPTYLLTPSVKNESVSGDKTIVHVSEPMIIQAEMFNLNADKGEMSDVCIWPAADWDYSNADPVSISSSMFNEWENSMNTMSSTVESQSQVMSEKLSQANTIYNNLTKVLSSTIEALLETEKEFFK